jgi:hypothetical protein
MVDLEAKMIALDKKINQPDKKLIALDRKIEKLEAADHSETIAKLDAERAELKIQHSQLSSDIMKFQEVGKISTRIAELTQEESTLAQMYEEWDAKKFMVESFIRAKVELLDKRVVRALGIKGLGVKMFSPLLNGGLMQICEVTYDGIPFQRVNRSRQIKIGLELIGVLAKHWQISPVVFIDNSEAVNELPEVDFQTIGLRVSNDTKLTVTLL